VIPKGAKLVGPRDAGFGTRQRRIGIIARHLFDKAILKERPGDSFERRNPGDASAQSGVSAAGSEMDTMGGMGASAAGPARPAARRPWRRDFTAGGAVGTVTNTAANVVELPANCELRGQRRRGSIAVRRRERSAV